MLHTMSCCSITLVVLAPCADGGSGSGSGFDLCIEQFAARSNEIMIYCSDVDITDVSYFPLQLFHQKLSVFIANFPLPDCLLRDLV